MNKFCTEEYDDDAIEPLKVQGAKPFRHFLMFRHFNNRAHQVCTLVHDVCEQELEGHANPEEVCLSPNPILWQYLLLYLILPLNTRRISIIISNFNSSPPAMVNQGISLLSSWGVRSWGCCQNHGQDYWQEGKKCPE